MMTTLRGEPPRVARLCVSARTRTAFHPRAFCSQSARLPAMIPTAADACKYTRAAVEAAQVIC